MSGNDIQKTEAELSYYCPPTHPPGFRQPGLHNEKRDKPAAVVIGYEDYKKLEALEDIYESKLLEETIKKGKFFSLEDVAKRVKVGL